MKKGNAGVVSFYDVDKTEGIVQIIKAPEGGTIGDITLALTDALITDFKDNNNPTIADKLVQDPESPYSGTYTVYNDTFIGQKEIRAAKSDGSAVTGDTSEKYDSIEVYISEEIDTLRALNIFETETPRNFVFRDSRDPITYEMIDNTGITSEGTLNVIGVSKEKSIISGKPADGASESSAYSMFVVRNASELNISDVTITGTGVNTVTSHNASVLDVVNEDAVVNVTNAVFLTGFPVGEIMFVGAGAGVAFFTVTLSVSL